MDVNKALTVLSRNPDAAGLDLAALALELARDEYPDLDVAGYLSELKAMAHELRPKLRGSLPTRVESLCRYLFHDLGFRGNERDYYDPRNSYLNEVLDRRTGLPITLSLTAMMVGKRAGLEVVGVGLPGHFVAKAVDQRGTVLFDPFHGGQRLTTTDCERLAEEASGQPFRATSTTLRAVPAGQLVQRLLTNLKAVYLRGGDFVRAARVISRLRQLNPRDSLQRRDLGATLLQAGQAGKAIDHLAAYLKDTPEADDVETVRQLLSRARGMVARWN
jgi:regulator of sirC expression with transglutaminase-like and TPR domain